MNTTPPPQVTQGNSGQFMSARERNQARANGTYIDPPKPQEVPPVPDVQCVHRSWSAVGKIRCNCANQPEVYGCDNKFVPSSYATPRLPRQPGDGPIVLADGSKVAPADDRYPSFLPMPLKEGEKPRPCDVVVCSSCPYRVDPPPHIARLKVLGIIGNHDPDTGHCDMLHVLPNVMPKPESVPAPEGLRQCTVTAVRNADLDGMLDATGCGLLIIYGQASNIQGIKPCLTARPALKVWLVAQDARQKREATPNVWYDLPDDLAAELKRHQDAAFATALARILE